MRLGRQFAAKTDHPNSTVRIGEAEFAFDVADVDRLFVALEVDLAVDPVNSDLAVGRDLDLRFPRDKYFDTRPRDAAIERPTLGARTI